VDSIEINGVNFERLPGVRYAHKYWTFIEQMKAKGCREVDLYRSAVLDDLWFIVYFVMRVKCANHPHWIKACMEVESSDDNLVIDLWGREAGKTTIISIARSIQKVLQNPEERIGIFSYAKTPAQAILRNIKAILEESQLLKDCFRDVLYQEPSKESPKWSEDLGLIVKRTSLAKEATFEAHGLIEGMPTGKHFTGRIYDDVETADLTYTPEIMQRLKDQFDMSQFLGSDGGWHRIVGTPYHHEGLLMYCIGKQLDGKPLYNVRRKPGTEGGEFNGEPTYWTHKYLAQVQAQMSRQDFSSQVLLDPTPRGNAVLNPDFLIDVNPQDIPKNLFRFMSVDPAGVRKDRIGDSWAMFVIGVNPYRDDTGASDIYILDARIEPLGESEAMDAVVDMYLKGGRILKLGVEKVGMMTAEIHVANALRARGKSLTIEAGNLVLLRPSGMSKQERIERNLVWPLNNGKIHISRSVPATYRQRLALEMEKYPFWHDDGLDALSYVYHMIRDYRFGPQVVEAKTETIWDVYSENETNSQFAWMAN
jgi:hypothetical protein